MSPFSEEDSNPILGYQDLPLIKTIKPLTTQMQTLTVEFEDTIIAFLDNVKQKQETKDKVISESANGIREFEIAINLKNEELAIIEKDITLKKQNLEKYEINDDKCKNTKLTNNSIIKTNQKAIKKLTKEISNHRKEMSSKDQEYFQPIKTQIEKTTHDHKIQAAYIALHADELDDSTLGRIKTRGIENITRLIENKSDLIKQYEKKNEELTIEVRTAIEQLSTNIVEKNNIKTELQTQNISLAKVKKDICLLEQEKAEAISSAQNEILALNENFKSYLGDSIEVILKMIITIIKIVEDIKILKTTIERDKIYFEDVKIKINEFIRKYFIKINDAMIDNYEQYLLDSDQLITDIANKPIANNISQLFINHLQAISNQKNQQQAAKLNLDREKPNKKLVKAQKKQKKLDAKNWNKELVKMPILSINFCYDYILQDIKKLVASYLFYTGHVNKDQSQGLFAEMLTQEKCNETQLLIFNKLLVKNNKKTKKNGITFSTDKKYGLWQNMINQKLEVFLIDFTILIKLPKGFINSYLNDYKQFALVNNEILNEVYDKFRANIAKKVVNFLPPQNQINADADIKAQFKNIDLLFKNFIYVQDNFAQLIMSSGDFYKMIVALNTNIEAFYLKNQDNCVAKAELTDNSEQICNYQSAVLSDLWIKTKALSTTFEKLLSTKTIIADPLQPIINNNGTEEVITTTALASTVNALDTTGDAIVAIEFIVATSNENAQKNISNTLPCIKFTNLQQ